MKPSTTAHKRKRRWKWPAIALALLVVIAGVALAALLAAMTAVKEGKGVVPAAAARKMRQGQENFRVVTAGGGVHNKKYAILLLDVATQSFQEVVSELKARLTSKGEQHDH